MMKYEISYADESYKRAQDVHVKFAKWFGGFDKVIAYLPKDIDEEFKQSNSSIFDIGRGGGYWIWKPYIVYHTLKQINDGDYLFYFDTGCVLLKNVDVFINIMQRDHQDIMVFEVYGHEEQAWTKRDIFEYFGNTSEECRKTNQIMGGFLFIKKTELTMSIIKEWLDAACTGTMITDAENETGLRNYDTFIENRHDQSLLSVLLKTKGIEPYRDPSQFGLYQKYKYKARCMNTDRDYKTYEKSTYRMPILLHRCGNIRMLGIIKCFYIRVWKKCKEYRKNPMLPI